MAQIATKSFRASPEARARFNCDRFLDWVQICQLAIAVTACRSEIARLQADNRLLALRSEHLEYQAKLSAMLTTCLDKAPLDEGTKAMVRSLRQVLAVLPGHPAEMRCSPRAIRQQVARRRA